MVPGGGTKSPEAEEQLNLRAATSEPESHTYSVRAPKGKMPHDARRIHAPPLGPDAFLKNEVLRVGPQYDWCPYERKKSGQRHTHQQETTGRLSEEDL